MRVLTPPDTDTTTLNAKVDREDRRQGVPKELVAGVPYRSVDVRRAVRGKLTPSAVTPVRSRADTDSGVIETSSEGGSMASDRSAAAEERRVHREQRRDVFAQGRPRSNGSNSGSSRRAASSVAGFAEVPAVIAQRVRSGISKNADFLRGPLRNLRNEELGMGAAAAIGAILGVVGAAKVDRRRRQDGNTVSGEVAVHLLNKIELLTLRLQIRQARNSPNSNDRVSLDVHHTQS